MLRLLTSSGRRTGPDRRRLAIDVGPMPSTVTSSAPAGDAATGWSIRSPRGSRNSPGRSPCTSHSGTAVIELENAGVAENDNFEKGPGSTNRVGKANNVDDDEKSCNVFVHLLLLGTSFVAGKNTLEKRLVG